MLLIFNSALQKNEAISQLGNAREAAKLRYWLQFAGQLSLAQLSVAQLYCQLLTVSSPTRRPDKELRDMYVYMYICKMSAFGCQQDEIVGVWRQNEQCSSTLKLNGSLASPALLWFSRKLLQYVDFNRRVFKVLLKSKSASQSR